MIHISKHNIIIKIKDKKINLDSLIKLANQFRERDNNVT